MTHTFQTRPSKKNSMRNNKKFPYKQGRDLNINAHTHHLENSLSTKRLRASNYAIVDENDHIIEKYRLYLTAAYDLAHQKVRYLSKLRVVKLKGKERKEIIELPERGSNKKTETFI